MIYDNAIEEVKEEEIIATDITVPVRLAQVTSLTNGKAAVKFYGDNESSTKFYSYIEGYKPVVNDIVAMLAQGNTFIILGKISAENITTNYYVLMSELSTILAAYLTTTDAASTYLSQTDAADTYETASHASDTYETASHASSTYETASHASSTYRGKSDPFNQIKNSSASLTISSGGDISANGTISMGTYAAPLDTVVTDKTRTKYLRAKSATGGGVELTSSAMSPTSNRGMSIGSSSYKLEDLYAQDIYGEVNSSSDRRLKKSIKTLGRKWLDFFYRLRPTSFKYKDGTSDRTHTGFIAQEVEAAANEVGIDTKDIATIVVDDGRYYLRYEELVAVQTLAIHDLKAQIDDLTARIHDLEHTVYK